MVSRGGGLAAEAFVREGARVVIVGQNAATVAAAADGLRGAAVGRGGSRGDVVAVVADVTSPADLDRVAAEARDAFGRLDVLFVNAGVGAFAPLEAATEAHFDAVFDVNVKRAYFTVQRPIYEKLGLSPEALDATRAHIVARVPLGRFGEPHEIAAVFLASDESRFVGAELVTDGGMSQL
jgi:NAD(P)-dependent dehydrogenase (short-subunit alcohol dehydrogenase family)